MPKLCVITGAGASNGAAGGTASASLVNSGWTPPLTRDLFEPRRDTFDPILQLYPQVNPLVHRARNAILRGDSLEKLLSEVYHSKNPYEQRQLKHLTYFLRRLFKEISEKYILGGPSQYDGLVDRILRRNIEVLFLTLNYDLLLEKALESYEDIHFNSVWSYVPKDSKWKLVKLHGSVNWGRKLLKQPDWVMPNPSDINLAPRSIDDLDLSQGLEEEIVIVTGTALPVSGASATYPVMMIPIEGKYEFACPDEHVQQAKEFLKSCPNFLVIGCSMNDQDICDLLNDNVPKVSRLLVNSNSDQGCQDTQSRMREIRAFSQSAGFYNGGFDKLMRIGKLETFLDEVSP